jgi:isocitrate dehydrogenase (NADP) (EC 1.1.1.42)
MSDYLEKIKSQIPNLQAYAGKYADPIEGEYVVYTGPGQLKVPDRLVVGYIEGDGTGPEVAYAAIKVANAAVEKAYGKARRVLWYEVLVGSKAEKLLGSRLPDQSVRSSEVRCS